ncbi:MAG TPA: acetylornithine transaminase [Candidatus Nitrosocosmicus sp.]|jgi:acetylornithine/N-succinyldiaminopimelate aminotransferase|nr:acetylornithine transaminase [Candidatus Nitrosocosmicus sp.]
MDFGHLMEITERPEIVFVEGRGSWLTDHAGKRYLDFVQGWAVNCLGHCPPAVVDALAAQSRTLINPSPAFFNEPALKLARLLAEHSDFQRTFFTNSGAEANEGAIKLARKWGRRFKGGAHEIITFDHGFHGRTLATMSASGKPGWDTMFAPQVPGFPKATLNDLASVEALIGERTAAVMLEPVQGESGVVPATVEFLRELRALTRRHRCLLIVDEVQTGVGRTGRLFAYQHFARSGEEAPDIMTLGKGLGAGVPLAALCATEAVSVFEHGEQGGTFNGSPLMTAVGVAVLERILAPGFLEEVTASGRYLSERLTAMVGELGLSHERGWGLLRAVDLGAEIAPAVVAYARDRMEKHPGWENAGLLLNAPRPELIRFMPALNVTRDEMDRMLGGLRLAIEAVR